MSGSNELGRLLLRNKLLGRWAAGKLGKEGDDANAYADALAANDDVFATLRKDFDAAVLAVSDADISEAITRFTVQAGNLLSGPRADTTDAAAFALKRNLTSR